MPGPRNETTGSIVPLSVCRSTILGSERPFARAVRM